MVLDWVAGASTLAKAYHVGSAGTLEALPDLNLHSRCGERDFKIFV